jgi:hypothetical protein
MVKIADRVEVTVDLIADQVSGPPAIVQSEYFLRKCYKRGRVRMRHKGISRITNAKTIRLARMLIVLNR